MEKDKSTPAQRNGFRRLNLKLPPSLHLQFKKKCKLEKMTMQKKLASIIRAHVAAGA